MEENKTFDPSQWVNPTSDNRQQAKAAVPVMPAYDYGCSTGDNSLARVRAVCNELLRRGANIADDQEDYYRLIEAMVELGDAGKEMCRQLCQQSEKYEEKDFEYKWQWCSNDTKRTITIATFYDKAKQAGVDLSAISRQYPSPEFSAKTAITHGYTRKGDMSTAGNGDNSYYSENKNIIYNNGNPDGSQALPAGRGAEMRNMRKTATGMTEQDEYQRFIFNKTFSDRLDPSKLPSLIADAMATQTDAEGKDKVCLSALVLFSGCMPNVKGVYGGKVLYATLYVMLIAPSGALKGIVQSCVQLVMPIEWEIRRQYDLQRAEYERQFQAWSDLSAKERKGTAEPKEPCYKSLFIAGNSSSRVVYDDLQNNGGSGIVFETEADTLASVQAQDWGQWSDLIRRSFHHERATLSRKEDHTHIVIEHPRMAMLLTCTPGQIPVLLPAHQVENGMANRYLFYCMRGHHEWIDPFLDQDKPLDDLLKPIGERFLKLYHALEQRADAPLEFTFSQEQKVEFSKYFSQLYLDQTGMSGDEISAFIFRLGVSTFRIAMVLTVLRCADKTPMLDPESNVLVCSDDDFNTAMIIADTLIDHTAHVYANLLPHAAQSLVIDGKELPATEQLLYRNLPEEYSTADWKKCANELNIPVRTAERYIGDFVNKYHISERITNGRFVKVRHRSDTTIVT